MIKSKNVQIFVTERAQYVSHFNKLTKVKDKKTSAIDTKMFEPEFMQLKEQSQ